MMMKNIKNYDVVNFQEINSEKCICGYTKRAFTNDPDKIASIHLLEVKTDSKPHYHKNHTELYYIVEGKGYMELNDVRIPVSPETAILIKPGCRHRAIGHLKVINIPIPAYNPGDVWSD
jgi:mannose-6-phosphate isomerase-like protein (cupin superfamily)